MAEEIRLSGRSAAPGCAVGPIVHLRDDLPERQPSGDPVREAADLRVAIDAALADLRRLIEAADAEAGDILAFQQVMLEDDELTTGVYASIRDGVDAAAAWRRGLDTEIAGYEAAEDEYFRARAADLIDIRDRVLGHLAGNTGPTIGSGSIVLAGDITPSRFLSIDWSGGAIALCAGSPTSHVAMLARSRGVPMVVSLGSDVAIGREALVDGDRGVVVIDPTPPTRAAFLDRVAERSARAAEADARLTEPAVTADGEPIKVMINIADPVELDHLDPAICDGIGLVRTELLFHRGGRLPSEDEQAAVYARIARWAAGRPVTIRTLDAGGDKPIPGLTLEEANPFLGVRGIRLMLRRRDVFLAQLKALARAAVHGDVRVMLPMVAVPSEVDAARALLDEAIGDLDAAGVACRRPDLGMMVEVPAAAIEARRFPVAFYSIGSNDLVQYTLAVARDAGTLADLASVRDPAVLHLIEMTVDDAGALGRDVSLCGDAGADPAAIPALLDAGLRCLSVAPPLVGGVKQAIRAWSASEGGGNG